MMIYGRIAAALFILTSAASSADALDSWSDSQSGLMEESGSSFIEKAEARHRAMLNSSLPDVFYEKEHMLMRKVLEKKYQTSPAQVIYWDEIIRSRGDHDKSVPENIEAALRKLIPGTEAVRLKELTEKGITAFRAGQSESDIFSSKEYTGADGAGKFLMQQLFRMGAAHDDHLESTERKYGQSLMDSAEGYALSLGLTKAQSVFFAEAAREAAAGTELSPIDDSAWPEHLKELRDGITEEFKMRHGGRSISELERQYLRKSAALILNAALAGDQSSTMLIDIAAINLLTRPF